MFGPHVSAFIRAIAEVLTPDDEPLGVTNSKNRCSICGEFQFSTPSGPSCPNGHGGVDPLPACKISMIWAQDPSGVIGREGKLPWVLPEDLAHFERATTGCVVIMGRKTWDSIPDKNRPLRDRKNIVVTADPDWESKNVCRADSLVAALATCNVGDEVWLIGGATIFAEGMAYAEELVVTEIAQKHFGDTYAPHIGKEWVETNRFSDYSEARVNYAFVTYKRATIRTPKPS